MIKRLLLSFFCFQFVIQLVSAEQFRFALFTDIHIQMQNDFSSIDLQKAVDDLNKQTAIDFVIVSGDITEFGDLASLQKAKTLLDKLKVPYYITLGNHETKWSESGSTDFVRVFGDDKFQFLHKGIYFIGFATGPVIKMGDGHIAPQDIVWVNNELSKLDRKIPIIAVTHYPLQSGDVDNWYEMTDVLRKYNVQSVLNGHYHRNSILNFDEIPGILNRSTLRGKDDFGGYSIYTVSDSLKVHEKNVGQPERLWFSLPIVPKTYNQSATLIRPSYEINKTAKNVKEVWRVNLDDGIYTKPCIYDNNVYFGTDSGYVSCVSLKNGNSIWRFKTASRIISSPAASDQKIVVGSTDGGLYCLDAKNGRQIWRLNTTRALMGCPAINGDTVFVGGSDGSFKAVNLQNGKVYWSFDEIKNYVESLPVLADGKVIFGAWDSYLYALNRNDGKLAWKWNNGNARTHFSPAAVSPVVAHGKVFITAPDRYWTALDIKTGQPVWRTKSHEVRETIGISEDAKTVYSRCMNDSVIALDALADYPKVKWSTNAGFGYDHNPSMLMVKGKTLVFGTKNGLLVGMNANNGKVLWKYKIGNSIINTVTPISAKECVLTTTEGVVCRLKY